MTLTLDHLAHLLRAEQLLIAAPEQDGVVEALATDSRAVTPGALFIALPGTQVDGHRFVAAAGAAGARAALVEHPVDTALPQVVVRDAHRAAIVLARHWHGHPTAGMRLVGITGTNGKTTTTALVRHLLDEGGNAGTIGTLGAFDGAGEKVPSTAGSLTTPGPVDLQATFAALAARGVRQVAMETSSHSLDQGRLDGLEFQAGIFTNLTREHLDYHETMARYLAAKLRLVDLLATDGFAIVNADDPAWAPITRRPLVTFGRSGNAMVRAEGEVAGAGGTRFALTGVFGTREIDLPIAGEFNVANALGAAACALALGRPLAEVADRLDTAPQVPGRMERLAAAPCTVLRDYCHTPDAFERVLAALRPLTAGQLVILFGCGGDRDRGKRPEMGEIAGRLADQVYLTTDNPRSEDPDRIIDDIAAGMGGRPYHRILDREEAIAAAIASASAGDTILLAGEGHETYQLIGGRKLPFDERAIVRTLTRQEP
ncbi:MAG: UDP-N-acetylmuramoyl-L-alanyl-D-glutamate--2,6-diaminopimelate ligase [Gemmatimonadales bacterium]|nr:UDP-N-acetylmuramoyl-L-alanyl-D-glutamate--2,6-diaminopimelate ligase [Gemmatimonadales bacterium]